MLTRRHLLAALALPASLSLVSIASAMERKPYDQAAFDAAQAAGKPILVEISASWCPICKAQAPILSRLRDYVVEGKSRGRALPSASSARCSASPARRCARH